MPRKRKWNTSFEEMGLSQASPSATVTVLEQPKPKKPTRFQKRSLSITAPTKPRLTGVGSRKRKTPRKIIGIRPNIIY